MQTLSWAELCELSTRYFRGEASLNDVAESYSLPDLCTLLADVEREVSGSVQGLTPAQVAFRLPGRPEGWDASGDEENFDISQIVTHLAVAMAFFRWSITRALGHPRPSFPRAPHGATVTGTAGSPMGRGGWSGVPAEDLARLLDETTNDFLEYLRELPPGTPLGAVTRYGQWGDLSVRGWVLLASTHTAWHLAQLEEIKSSESFPGDRA